MAIADDAIAAWLARVPAQRPLHLMRLARERRRERAANPGWESREELARAIVLVQRIAAASERRAEARENARAKGGASKETDADDHRPD